MPFDINPSGNISITPLVSYEPATVADELVALRLVLANPEDELGTGSLVVQTTMSVIQAQSLVTDLQHLIDRIVERRRTARPQ